MWCRRWSWRGFTSLRCRTLCSGSGSRTVWHGPAWGRLGARVPWRSRVWDVLLSVVGARGGGATLALRGLLACSSSALRRDVRRDMCTHCGGTTDPSVTVRRDMSGARDSAGEVLSSRCLVAPAGPVWGRLSAPPTAPPFNVGLGAGGPTGVSSESDGLERFGRDTAYASCLSARPRRTSGCARVRGRPAATAPAREMSSARHAQAGARAFACTGRKGGLRRS